MKNREQIKKLRDNAELAMAAYGYYDLITNNTNQSFIILKDEKGNSKTDSNGNPITQQVNLTDILDMTYKDYKVYIPSRLPTLKPDEVGTLKGDFTPTQAKNFFDRYDLLEHCPNTDSGFSATLFKDLGEVDKKANTRKAVDKDSQYILSFRGTE